LGGRGFESRLLHRIVAERLHAEVAQLVRAPHCHAMSDVRCPCA